jgi:hypothetical protein
MRPIAYGIPDLGGVRLRSVRCTTQEEHMTALRNKLILAGAIAALGAGSLGPVGIAQAKHGADDPAGHDAGDDHGGRRADDGVRVRARAHHARHRHHHHARHGRDDRPGDDHGRR